MYTVPRNTKMARTISPEYKAFQAYFSRLVTAVKSSISHVAREAFSKSLISKQSMDSAMNRMYSEDERATSVLSQILDRIQEKDDNFQAFISILRTESTLRGIADDLVEECKLKMSIQPAAAQQCDHSPPATALPTSDCDSEKSSAISFKCSCGNNCSLDTFVRGDCRGQLERQFPFLNIKQLADRDKDRLIRKLVRETNKMIQQFENLTYATFLSLNKSCAQHGKPIVEKLLNIALNFGQGLPKPVLQQGGHRHELLLTTTVDDVLTFLLKHRYISFFNYRILAQIIEQLGAPSDKENLERYIKEYGEFCKRKIFEVPSSVLTQTAPTTEQMLTVKIDEKLWFGSNHKSADSEFTMNDIYAIEDIIAAAIDVDPAYILLLDLKEGCIELSFGVLLVGLFGTATIDSQKISCHGINVIEQEKVSDAQIGAGIGMAEIESEPAAAALTMADHNKVCGYLRLGRSRITELGSTLGLKHSMLRSMFESPSDMVTAWLKEEDEARNPSWNSLVTALLEIGCRNTAVAIHIAEILSVKLPIPTLDAAYNALSPLDYSEFEIKAICFRLGKNFDPITKFIIHSQEFEFEIDLPLRFTLQEWLKQTYPVPAWQALADAVQHCYELPYRT